MKELDDITEVIVDASMKIQNNLLISASPREPAVKDLKNMHAESRRTRRRKA